MTISKSFATYLKQAGIWKDYSAYYDDNAVISHIIKVHSLSHYSKLFLADQKTLWSIIENLYRHKLSCLLIAHVKISINSSPERASAGDSYTGTCFALLAEFIDWKWWTDETPYECISLIVSSLKADNVDMADVEPFVYKLLSTAPSTGYVGWAMWYDKLVKLSINNGWKQVLSLLLPHHSKQYCTVFDILVKLYNAAVKSMPYKTVEVDCLEPDAPCSGIMEMARYVLSIDDKYSTEQGFYSYTPIEACCRNSCYGLVDMLLEVHPQLVNYEEKGGFVRPPLFIAIHQRSLKLVKFLIKHGANIGYYYVSGRTAFGLAMSLYGKDDPLTMYIATHTPQEMIDEYYTDFNSRENQGLSVLHRAIMKGKLHKAKYMAERGADISKSLVVDGVEKTPYEVALEYIEFLKYPDGVMCEEISSDDDWSGED